MGEFTLFPFPHHGDISNTDLLEIVNEWNLFLSVAAKNSVQQIAFPRKCEFDWEDVTIPEGWLEMGFRVEYSSTELHGVLQVTVTTWSKATLFQYEIEFSRQGSLDLPHPRELLQQFPKEFWVEGLFSDSFVKIVPLLSKASLKKEELSQPPQHFCSICLETTVFDLSYWTRLDCRHNFHGYCLYPNHSNLDFSDGVHLCVTGTCPLCRRPYKLFF
jgi:hypothetical protein